MADRNAIIPPLVSEIGRVKVADAETNRALTSVVTTLEAVLRFLAPFVRPSGWKKPAWGAGWQDYTGAIGTYQTAAYKKDPLNRVHLRGLVERASGAATTIMVLPIGHRPAKQKVFVVFGSSGVGRVDVHSDGVVEYSSGGVTFLSLEGISFDLDD